MKSSEPTSMQKTSRIYLFLMMLLSSVTLYAQDVAVPGPGGCGAAAISSTFDVPCGVTSVTVELYGGGGGGGGRGGGSNGGFFDTRGGGGGGSGGYVSFTVDVIPGSTFSYSVGGGGCGGGGNGDGSSGDNGGGGGNTTITGTDALGNPVNLAANGGARGTGGSGTEGSAGSGGAGGTASGGSTNTTGTAGSNGNGGNGGAGGASGSIYGSGGVGGGDPGGNGVGGAILITFVTQGPPPVTPIVATTSETCSSDGTATIGNYAAAETYVFTPTGPTAGAGGVISGMTVGTNYTVVAGTGNCASGSSNAFSVAAATGSVVDPTVSTTAATCSADGNSVITTYNATMTYTFTPTGPTVAAGGAISGMTTGTSYTVTESDQTCTSAPSAAFSNDAQFPAPNITISGTLSYCLGSNTTITASGGVSYIWDDTGNSTTDAITVTQGTYNVGALDANGCPGTASVTVVETAPFAITITGPLSHCIGGNTTITASGGTSYSWNDLANSTTATVTLTQGNYTVTATDGAGCVSTEDVVITESAAPVAAFVVIDACDGTAVEFTDATTIATGNLTNWNWDFGDNTQSTDQDPTHVYAQPGTYDVTLVVGAGSCTDQITIQATSFENPVADFTTADVCVGTDATFTDNSSVTGSTIAQWGWDFDGEGNSIQQFPSFAFPSDGTYNVTLAVVSADLCTATFTDQVIIFPAPVPVFSAADVCEGSVTTFQNTSTVSSGTISAQVWDFGDNAGVSVGASPTYTYPAAGTYSVTLGVTTSEGCIAATAQNVTVNPLPVIDASSTDVLCAGQANGTVTASASGANAPYGYQWNDIFQSTTASVQNLNSGSYTITVTDALGCVSDTTVTVLQPLPIIVDMIAGDDTCGLGNGAVQAVMLGGTAPFQYVWSSINDSTTIYSEDVTPSGWNTMLSSGQYSVTVTDVVGCRTTGLATVGVIASPEAAFSTRSKPEEFIDPSVQFVNESTGAVSYEWHLGEGNVSYEEDPLF
ncbi:MAG: PKD domain-containing protein, partial [Flavobacteriales bacterium]|nr:PKD domain-containing protein [Flavobacteriales bacterium]